MQEQTRLADKASLGIIDYVVLGGAIIISLAIGLYHGLKTNEKKSRDFLTGGKNNPVYALTFSLLGGSISAITILGNASESYYYGTQFWINVVFVPFGALIVALVIAPVLYPMNIVSMYEYIEIRWKSPSLRKICTAIQLFNMLFYVGVVAYAPSLALASVTPVPTFVSIIVLGAVCTLYSAVGGAKAVIYTDVFQTAVMVLGVILVIIKGTSVVGGVEQVWKISTADGRNNFLDLNPNPTVRVSFWTSISFGFFLGIQMFGSNQPQFQRWSSTRSLFQARLVLALSAMGAVVIWSLCFYSGLVIYSVYSGCDPWKAGHIDKMDQVSIYFVVNQLGNFQGLSGLFVAAIYCGVLSSVSSQINSVVAIIWEDFLKPFSMMARLSERNINRLMKILSILTGVVVIVLAILAGVFANILQAAYSISGSFGGPLSGIFLTGVLCPWVGKKAATLGILTSISLSLWIVIGSLSTSPPPSTLPLSIDQCSGQNLTTVAPIPTTYRTIVHESKTSPEDERNTFPLYLLSYNYYMGIGCLTTLIVSNSASLIFGFSRSEDIGENSVYERVMKKYQRMNLR